MELKTNELLFRKWQILGERVKHTGSIAQNDMDWTPEMQQQAVDMLNQLQLELDAMVLQTLNYLQIERPKT